MTQIRHSCSALRPVTGVCVGEVEVGGTGEEKGRTCMDTKETAHPDLDFLPTRPLASSHNPQKTTHWLYEKANNIVVIVRNLTKGNQSVMTPHCPL